MPLLQPRRPFLGAQATPSPRVILLGAPLDQTESFKAGTAEAPDRIRAVSDVLETYSPALDRDLEQLAFADWGDVDLDGLSMESALAAIADAIAQASALGLPILLGGEHTATLGGVEGILRRYPDTFIVHLDGHTDLRDTYEGQRLSHATVLRRLADVVGLDHIIQLGIRSGTREEHQIARQCIQSGLSVLLSEQAMARISGQPIYLTIDIDVLDPSCAPGTGCPEPGGATFAEVLALIYTLRGMRVVGVDIMEVLPAADVNDITSVAAAKLVRECALAFGDQSP